LKRFSHGENTGERGGREDRGIYIRRFKKCCYVLSFKLRCSRIW